MFRTTIKKNLTEGMSLLEKSCALKNANACYYLSGMYISGIKKQEAGEKIPGLESFEVQKDMKKAFHYALEGCNLGNVYSCANLSQMYNKGDGVEKNAELAEKYKAMALELQEQITSNKTLSFQEGLPKT